MPRQTGLLRGYCDVKPSKGRAVTTLLRLCEVVDYHFGACLFEVAALDMYN